MLPLEIDYQLCKVGIRNLGEARMKRREKFFAMRSLGEMRVRLSQISSRVSLSV